MLKPSSAIVVEIVGGLGNQLFGYAMGRALSLRSGLPLLLDIAFFRNVRGSKTTTIRIFGLDKLGISSHGLAEFWGRNKILFCMPQVIFLSLFFGRKIYSRRHKSIYQERIGYVFDQEVFHCKEPRYFSGYWQSYKYFEDYADVIRAELGQVGIVSAQTQDMLNRIEQSESVCIHIRRGDYVKLGRELKGLDYYHKGLEIVRQGLVNPCCFVFSDDPRWVRENLQLDAPMVVVDINGADNPQEDLWLMAACNRFVIANSTLSWWGAWLSNKPDKIVVAPKHWTSDGRNTDELIPPDWVRI